MTNDMERSMRISLIIEEFREGNYSEEVARRELILLGCNKEEVDVAFGNILLNEKIKLKGKVDADE